MNSSLIFEQPLNERIRTFMRLEALLYRFWHFLQQPGPYEMHSALQTLMELFALTSRMDLKQELIRELERLSTSLAALRTKPGVDLRRLDALIEQQRLWVGEFHVLSGQMDHAVKDNDLFNSIRQRMSIPGGTCEFDLPVYHHWLNKPIAERRAIIQQWAAPFINIQEAVASILRIIRKSGVTETVTARAGFYEQALDAQRPWQLIQINLPADSVCYPEISAGRQRFNVRFLNARDDGLRPAQTRDDVCFTLSCCAI